MIDTKVISDAPLKFDELLTTVAKEQLGLDGSYTVYAVETDQIDEINLKMIEGLDDIHLHCFTVRLPLAWRELASPRGMEITGGWKRRFMGSWIMAIQLGRL
ncbi:hypothetical protein HSBAA_PA_2760 (plasmid) [Vreelandella sulfidaeris]|uniref:Uncharacterized protein n=1 Tax=Vreelandella sulfidaeris TaxID=115553 RepID=A0A455UJX7_9GAMM|nr:hypothetical protein HSBAA_PA_2760 [Halomonas sulfidaeris]